MFALLAIGAFLVAFLEHAIPFTVNDTWDDSLGLTLLGLVFVVLYLVRKHGRDG